jgi:histidinol-phosphate phosphatase family protein
VKKIEAVFIDRDGTIGGDDTVHYPGEFELFPYSASEISRLKNDGISIFSFTNQPGISRGLAKEKDFVEELLAFGFDGVYLCPHDHHEGCQCRKPNTGMLTEARKDNELNLENCVVIGDRWSDMVAASRVGSIKILVRTGAGKSTLSEHSEKLQDVKIDYIANNLLEAIDWLYEESLIRSNT